MSPFSRPPMSLTHTICRLVAPAIAFASVPLFAQSQVAARLGDSSVVAAIDATTRLVYDSAGGRVFQFTSGNLLGIAGSTATELQATFLRGAVGRVVAGTWGSGGKYGVEFYFNADTLVFTFESFEFVAGSAPPDQWQNFKKIPTWERRIYWRGQSAALSETSGRSAVVSAEDRQRLLAAAEATRRLMAARARELSSSR